MSKIKVNVSFDDKETSYKKIYNAIYKEEDKEIIYKEQEDITMKYNIKNNVLTRTTLEFTAKYNLNKKVCNLTINNTHYQVSIPLVIKRITSSQNSLEIEYQIEEKTIYYKVEIIY